MYMNICDFILEREFSVMLNENTKLELFGFYLKRIWVFRRFLHGKIVDEKSSQQDFSSIFTFLRNSIKHKFATSTLKN